MKYPISIIFLLLLLSLNTFSQVPPWAWAKNPGVGYEDIAWGVCTDASGNVYMTGVFSTPSISFGSFTLTNVNPNNDTFDIYLVKYTPNGNVLWAKSAGGRSWDWGRAVTTDLLGNVYLVGDFWSDSITFGNTVLTNHNNVAEGIVFLVKYDSTGNVLWARSAGKTVNQAASTVSTDILGNVYIGGIFQSDTIIFGATTLRNADTTINATSDIFLAKYDSSGNVLWAKRAGGNSDDYINSIKSNAIGEVYVAGYFQSDSIIFGTTILRNTDTMNNTSDIFLVKYDSSGNVVWAKSEGRNQNDCAYSLSLDGSQNIYICGTFQSQTISFDSYTLANSGTNTDDIFIAKYDSVGNVIWVKPAGGTDNDEAISISTDAYGYVYLTGHFFSSTITFGNMVLTNTNSGTTDIFITKYDTSGNTLWAKRTGGNYYDFAGAIANDTLGNLYLVGAFESPLIYFDIYPFTNPSQDKAIFIAKINNSTGNEEIKAFGGVSVYPNPASSTITVKSEELRVKNEEFRVMDVFGRVIHAEILTKPSTEIDVREWSAGVYFYEVRNEQENHRGKIIKE